MNYRPDTRKYRLWDTWMFPDPDGRRMHLFYLKGLGLDGPFSDVGHVVSEDYLHWESLPDIPVRLPDDTYDVGVIGTGMVFVGPDGAFWMSYTTNILAGDQRIAFLRSTDLIHWKKTRQEPCIDSMPPHYETQASRAVSDPFAFRDAFILRRGDAYEALVAGHSAQGAPLLRGCIARYRSTDPKLETWQPLAPLLGPGITMLIEVPDYFELNGRHYLLYSTAYCLGVTCNTRSRRNIWGTFYAMADTYEGPYTIPENNMLLGAGDCPPLWQAAIGRVAKWKGECFIYHQTGAPPHTATGLPKCISQSADGTLSVRYWPGSEKIHLRKLTLPLDAIRAQGANIHVGEWTAAHGSWLQGFVDGGGSLGLIPGEFENIHLRCRVTAESAKRFGISVRDLGQGTDRPGVALQGDLEFGEWHFGSPNHGWCSWIAPIEKIVEPVSTGRTYQIDIIVRDIYFEAYVDGVWKFTRVIDAHARHGGIGFYVESGKACFSDIQLWELEPMVHPFSLK
jgi:beta-fructofuranosidase